MPDLTATTAWLTELRSERDQIDALIRALEAYHGRPAPATSHPTRKAGRTSATRRGGPRARTFSIPELQQARQWCEKEGASFNAIATRLKCSWGMVRKLATQHGWQPKKRP